MITLHTARWAHEFRNERARAQVRGPDCVSSESFRLASGADYRGNQQIINWHRWQQINRRLLRAEGHRYSLP